MRGSGEKKNVGVHLVPRTVDNADAVRLDNIAVVGALRVDFMFSNIVQRMKHVSLERDK